MHHNAAQAYLKTQVNTVSPGKLLLLLYEAAIKFLHQAKEKMEEKDYAAKGILISKAIDVISELDESLNAQKGGQLAENLHGLYFFCNTRLLHANMQMDPKIVDEVLQVLEGLRSAFTEINAQQSGVEASVNSLDKAGAGTVAAVKAIRPDAQNSEQDAAPGNAEEPSDRQPNENESEQATAPPKPRKLPGAYGRIGGYK